MGDEVVGEAHGHTNNARDPVLSGNESVVVFDGFELRPAARVLTTGGRPVPLGARAFDILKTLVEHKGRVVSHAELVASAWPTTHVEEGNLRVQISTLRGALVANGAEPGIITNVAHEGYTFTGLTWVVQQGAIRGRSAGALQPPPAGGELFGREADLARVRQGLATDRLVTVVGPGGVGKTRLALEAARDLDLEAICFVDLASATEPSDVPAAVAAALALEPTGEDPTVALQMLLQNKSWLVILDTCEAQIDAVATLVTTLLSHAPRLQLLATSRQPLQVNGERVVRLEGLQASSCAPMDMDEADRLESILLFRHDLTGSSLAGAYDPALLTQLCHQLDGIPLALQLAAKAVGRVGLATLVQRLDMQFEDLTTGAAGGRQGSMKASLDWSYARLSQDERQLLARLSTVRSEFTLDTALALLIKGDGSVWSAIRALAQLVDKSIVLIVSASEPILYRLPHLVRLYAQQTSLADATPED